MTDVHLVGVTSIAVMGLDNIVVRHYSTGRLGSFKDTLHGLSIIIVRLCIFYSALIPIFDLKIVCIIQLIEGRLLQGCQVGWERFFERLGSHIARSALGTIQTCSIVVT